MNEEIKLILGEKLIIGEKEIESNTISVRKRGEGDLGSMTLEEFTKNFEKELESRI